MSHSLPDIGQAEQESPRNSHSMADQEMDDIVVFSSDNEHARAVELENDDEFLFPNRLRDQPPPPKWKFSFFSSFTKGTFIFVTMLVLGIVAGIIAWIKISLGGSDTGTPNIVTPVAPRLFDITPESILDVITGEEAEAAARAHMTFLSDDLLEGRAPGTRGEQLAAKYVASIFAEAGLLPAGDNDTFFQNVPFRGAKAIRDSFSPLSFSVTVGGAVPRVLSSAPSAPSKDAVIQPISVQYVSDYVAATDFHVPSQSLTNVGLVFVGYGINASHWSWDDYKDVDVSDKVLLCLVNEPQPTETEPDLFAGDTLTYFGRWTYKFEEARRRGAAGILLVHTTAMAGYPWAVPRNGFQNEIVALRDIPQNPLSIRGWISSDATNQLALAAGFSNGINDLLSLATSRSFRPIDLATNVSASMAFNLRLFDGVNVHGILRGEMQNLNCTGDDKEETILISAHHDHLGIGPADTRNDTIYNGALDNASGVAGMLSILSAFRTIPSHAMPVMPTERYRPSLKRSILFSSVTGEESNLLGALYYTQHPTVPLNVTVANINLDGMNIWGLTRDIIAIGADKSDLEELFALAATDEGMIVARDSTPNLGHFFRGDQFSYAKAGIVGLNPTTGDDFIGQPANFAATTEAQYIALHYHQPSDEMRSDMKFDGFLQQVRVSTRLAYGLAQSNLRPTWKPGHSLEF